MNRRSFLGTAAAGVAASGLLSSIPDPVLAMAKRVNMPLGFQSYVFRNEIAMTPNETMSRLAGFGYKNIEWCSPKGYQGEFAPLAKYTGKELKKITNDAGLETTSCHFTWKEITDDTNLAERIEFANQLGLKCMVCSGAPKSKTEEELKTNCDKLNHFGEQVKKAGLIAGYHNHNGEFDEKFNSRPHYDIMLEHLDPSSIKMQFQVAAITSGYKAQDYFRKFPGRFISAHLQDYEPNDHTKETIMGTGIVDWKDFFEAAKVGGLKYYFVEMESNPVLMKGCADYVKTL